MNLRKHLKILLGFILKSLLRGRNPYLLLSNVLSDTAFNGIEYKVISNMLKVREIKVEDVMVPRADIAAVEESASFKEVFEVFCNSGHTALPVYRSSLDDCTGFIKVKDILFHNISASPERNFRVSQYVRRGLFVPPSVTVGVLLDRMQSARIRFALVVDEYGGVDGLVTIEDLISQIVGRFDDVSAVGTELFWSQEAKNSFACDARTSIDEFDQRAEVNISRGYEVEEVDTIGGLVCLICGRVPERGEVVFHSYGHEFEVLDANTRCIKRLRVILNRKGDNIDENEGDDTSS